MKFKNFTAALFFGLCANGVSAQAPAAPAPTPAPATTTAATSAEPAAASTAPAPAAAPTSSVVEGALTGSQRATNDKGQFQWICTYRVAGAKRAVQLDESCPATLPFRIKR